jgi:multidrug efflux pump subunit AcrA (membrane-fusion protein)
MAPLRELLARRRGWTTAAIVIVLVGVTFGTVRLARTAPKVPNAEVERGEFVDRVELRGEVRALRSLVLIAPFGAGDIQILSLAKNGTMVKQGDTVIEFDSTALQRQLEQRQTELKQAEAEINRIRAQRKLVEEADLTDLQRAKYDVERARLEVTKGEILSAIEGEENKLLLANAEKKLLEVEQRLESDRIGTQADVANRVFRRSRVEAEVARVQKAIEALLIKAPVDGLVNIMTNERGGGRMGRGSGPPPEYRPGDRAWPGAPVAQIPDLSTLRVAARVEEIDRGRVSPGQSVTVRVDAIPDKDLTAKVLEVSPMAKLDFSTWPPARNFDVLMGLDLLDARLRPGMTATPRIAVERIADAIMIPADAAFQKSGRMVAYVLRGSKYEERAIEVLRRGNGKVVVTKGLQPGERVALADPTILER